MSEKHPIIVIGSGLAAYSLVREFRKLDSEFPVLIITQDDGHNYSKPMLSTGFTKNKSAEDLSIADAGKMALQLAASIRTFTTVTRIDPAQSCIYIGSECLPYSKLVLATGAQPNKLNFPGSTLQKVCSINDLMDYRKFRHSLHEKRHVLIMGAGLIGCEYANDLVNGGYKVSLVDPSSSMMSGLIPKEAGDMLGNALSEAGVSLYQENSVQSLSESSEGSLEVKLNKGESLVCDVVISAIGLKPNITLAQDAGLACNKGIITNAILETSHKNIYALGDCAETLGSVRLYVLPLMASARTLAKTLTGENTPIEFGIMPIATKTPLCPIVTVPPDSDKNGEWFFDSTDQGLIGRFKTSQGKVIGFVLAGEAIKLKAELSKELA